MRGAQRPRVSNAPSAVSSSGQEAKELAASAGLILDPWQAHALDVILGERPDGRWSAFEAAVCVARQNGKGGILEARELAGLFLFGERLILHSAHEFKTAQEAFLRIKSLVENTDELRRQVARIRTSHGEEGIELIGGARLRFVARSKSSGRGFSGDLIMLDEAQELPRSAMGALLPTLSARPNPQVIYTGTVPTPENDSEHWESVRDRGRTGGDPSLAWLEWSPEPPSDEGDYDLDDREAWAQSNPALGFRITEETIERERNSLDDDTFARERLSIWGSGSAKTVVDMRKWAKLADPRSAVLDPVAFAVDVTPDRSRSSIAVAGRRRDGQMHGEIVDNDRGTSWVVEKIADVMGRAPGSTLTLDASGPAGSLISDLREIGIEPALVSGRDLAAACGAVVDHVHNGTVCHLDQPPLNAALGAARKRPMGDAFAWHRKDPTADISPLVAWTLALYGSDQMATSPKRSGRVW